MAPKTCFVCQRSFVEGKTFLLTAEEKAAIGSEALNEIHYCLACLKVMQDPVTGPQLLKGFYEMSLREAGVPQEAASKMAARFHKKLIDIPLKTVH